jgi:hypothetical protein
VLPWASESSCFNYHSCLPVGLCFLYFLLVLLDYDCQVNFLSRKGSCRRIPWISTQLLYCVCFYFSVTVRVSCLSRNFFPATLLSLFFFHLRVLYVSRVSVHSCSVCQREPNTSTQKTWGPASVCSFYGGGNWGAGNSGSFFTVTQLVNSRGQYGIRILPAGL